MADLADPVMGTRLWVRAALRCRAELSGRAVCQAALVAELSFTGYADDQVSPSPHFPHARGTT